MSNLNANRQGNIVYVGEKLPAQARNLVSRTLRLNQVRAENAALFLATQGATGQRLTTEVEETIDPETGKVAQRIEKPATLEEISNPGEDGENNAKALLLKGLQVSTDDRLNSITLVGEPRKVEVAVAFLTQLDARRRQVAVNVKVIDINLLNTDSANSSFSFGVNDTFFLQDRGSAVLNFGGENPRVSDTLTFRRSGDETTRFESIPEGNSREIGIPQASSLPRKFLALLESEITTGNAKVLTDPTLIVQEGQQATVKLTQEIVQSVETTIDGDSGTRTITPTIGEAGLTLGVDIERIDDNGFISLSVSPKISSVGGTQSFDSGGGAINTLNLLSVRETNSGLIRLKDSQTLILSGIIQDQERTNITKVPILGDIPLLGALFRSSNKTNERAEVIVLLTPEIVDEQSDFGYDYTPGKESREVLEKSGVQLPGNP
jgi:type IV pilus assembly protein PilQ